MDTEIKQAIDDSISQERPIKVSAFAVLPETEKVLSYITESILIKYDKQDMLGPTYTAAVATAQQEDGGAGARSRRDDVWPIVAMT